MRELDQLKDELMATITHELLTPLTVVHGYAGHLQQQADAMEPVSVKRAAEQILKREVNPAVHADLLDRLRTEL